MGFFFAAILISVTKLGHAPFSSSSSRECSGRSSPWHLLGKSESSSELRRLRVFSSWSRSRSVAPEAGRARATFRAAFDQTACGGEAAEPDQVTGIAAALTVSVRLTSRDRSTLPQFLLTHGQLDESAATLPIPRISLK